MDEDEQLAHAISMSLNRAHSGHAIDNEDDSVIYLSDTDRSARPTRSRTDRTIARDVDDVIDLTSDLSDVVGPEDIAYGPDNDAFFEPEMDAELNFAMKLSKEAEESERKIRQVRPQTEEEEAQALRIAIQASLTEDRTRSENQETSDLKRPHRSSSVFETSSSPSQADRSASDDDDSRSLSQRRREEQEERRRTILIARSKKRGSFGRSTSSLTITPCAASGSTAKSVLFHSDPEDEQEDGNKGDVNIGPSHNSKSATTVPPLVVTSDGLEGITSSKVEGKKTDDVSSKSNTSPQSLSIPSRAQMEAERLARVQARQSQNSSSTPATNPPSSKVHLSASTAGSTSSHRGGAASDSSEPPRKRTKVDSTIRTSSQNASRQRSNELHWQGVLGVTPNVYAKETTGGSQVFGPNDVIGDRNEIAFSILSTYCFHPDFLPNHFPHPSKAPIILVSPPPAVELAGKSSYDTLIEGVWSCFPYLPKSFSPNFGLFIGACHMKFMLLFYKSGRMRTVITSANFMGFDWESIENGVWIQDFMPLLNGSPPKADRSDFGNQWEYVLKSLGVEKTLDMMSETHLQIPISSISHIHRYDFSKVNVRLVASTRGSRTGWEEVEKAGVARLGKIIREEHWIAKAGFVLPHLEAQGSSLAAATPRWLNDFWKLSNGLDPRDWLVVKSTIKTYPPIKLIYPSLATVQASEMGTLGGGTMFFTRKNWIPGIQPLFHDANSKRARVMMHIKMLLAVFEKVPQTLGSTNANGQPLSASSTLTRQVEQKIEVAEDSETEDEEEVVEYNKKTEKTSQQVGGWMYMGSHNFTQSAWGNLSLKKDVGPSLSLMNYELGIVFPLPVEKAQETASALATWQRPPRKYSPSDIPWIQNENM